MKRKDFATLQSVYSILGMSLTRKGKLFIAGRFANIPGCCFQTLKTESIELIIDANQVFNNFLQMEKI